MLRFSNSVSLSMLAGWRRAAVAGMTVSGVAASGLVALPLAAVAETGIMSHYSSLGVTASGRSYGTGDAVAAHKTLPLGSIVRIENTRNGRSTTVRIVDRGPYIAGRIIDVSPGVAGTLGFNGLAPSRITVIGRGPSVGPYDRGGKATGSSSTASATEDAPKARSKPVRTASAESAGNGRRRAAASGSSGPSGGTSEARGAYPRDGS